MARISIKELYRGKGVGVKYGSDGTMGSVTKEMLSHGGPEGYDEQTWLEMLTVKYALIAADKMKIEGDTVPGMTDDVLSSSYVRWDNDDV